MSMIVYMIYTGNQFYATKTARRMGDVRTFLLLNNGVIRVERTRHE